MTVPSSRASSRQRAGVVKAADVVVVSAGNVPAASHFLTAIHNHPLHALAAAPRHAAPGPPPLAPSRPRGRLRRPLDLPPELPAAAQQRHLHLRRRGRRARRRRRRPGERGVVTTSEAAASGPRPDPTSCGGRLRAGRRFPLFFFFVSCGRNNLTAQDNRLSRVSHTVGPSAHENIDFSRHLGVDGQIIRTEKSF
ncbi:uncharacterized protein [Oryza sativa Japonica Group]|uniref:Expressed protein n=2 Tax=Oryza sativa subsp. japonica TaxID=39947 RepID=Q75LY0_ORYSJ|nr:uncharacterized protein LOC4333700 [Oryza sativa Japonica Group]AAR87207.1 expressed protein [Oryza sativa Japonica Group]ABF98144.1 expressed protein [Oryza sativa Japonica Group]BAF12793.1 Os03g0673600 [Oryza sativa Japonica Group]BAG88277.1 unnamed protein product [Oryza sativa Japonica Group]BAG90950.1 unnamed protein product [Oryza sativa Japonica Group]|eukprot:NP_001050879.1 Os03g0673600 [Oryza sativa Japonica Group]